MGVWRELTSDPTEYVALHSLRLQIKKLNLPAAAAWRTCGHSLRALLLPRSLLQLAVQLLTSLCMHLSLRVALERAACCARSAASFTLSPAVTFIFSMDFFNSAIFSARSFVSSGWAKGRQRTRRTGTRRGRDAVRPPRAAHLGTPHASF